MGRDDEGSGTTSDGWGPQGQCQTSGVATAEEHSLVDRLSAAIRAHDVLEPWCTESHWDEHYWDGEADAVVCAVGPTPEASVLRAALIAVLTDAFGPLKPGGGLIREDLDVRLDLVVRAVVHHEP